MNESAPALRHGPLEGRDGHGHRVRVMPGGPTDGFVSDGVYDGPEGERHAQRGKRRRCRCENAFVHGLLLA